MPLSFPFHLRLAPAREDAQMTLAQLAALTGIPEGKLAIYEAGTALPPPEDLWRLSMRLNTSVSSLIEVLGDVS